MTFRLALAALLLTAGAAAAQGGASCAPSDLADVREEFAEGFGDFRKAQGLPVLSTNDMVQTAAQTFACEIAATGRLDHEAPDGARAGVRLWRAGYDWCRVGEILAVGQDDAEAVLEAWKASPPHRQNLALDQVAEYGLGLAYGDKDDFPQFKTTRKGSPVWVLMVTRLCP